MAMDTELFKQAREAASVAYVPYSHFSVGAALVAKNGLVFQGCNIENASFGMTNCAERTAIFKAVSEGHRLFQAIAIIADTEDPCAPCGACRQVMVEFNIPTIILTNLKGHTQVYTLDELLPLSFGPKDL